MLPNRVGFKKNFDTGVLFEELGVLDEVRNKKEKDSPDSTDKSQKVSKKIFEKPSVHKDDEREGLVCLFFDMLSFQIITPSDVKKIMDLLLEKDDSDGKQRKSIYDKIKKGISDINPDPQSVGLRYGQFSSVINDYLDWIMTVDFGDQKNINNILRKTLLNSLSISYTMYDAFVKTTAGGAALGVRGKPLHIVGKNAFTDMGINYDEIRRSAASGASSMSGSRIDPDKWCPADLFIYKDKRSMDELRNFDLSGKDDIERFSQFLSLFDTGNKNVNVIGVSLKEEQARQGRATSFIETLNQSEHYQDKPESLSTKERVITDLLTNARKSLKSEEDKRRYWNKPTGTSFVKIFKSKDMISSDGYNGKFAGLSKESFEGEFSEAKFKKLISAINKESIKLAVGSLKTLKVLRKEVIESLKGLKMNPKFSNTSFKESEIKVQPDGSFIGMTPEHMLKKIACYSTSLFIFNKFEEVGIRDTFKNLSTTKNPLAALTAYAVGMAGFSPTFFKLTGSNTGSAARYEPIYGSGVLEIDDKIPTEVIDTIGAGAFIIKFVVGARQSKEGKEIVKQYETRITFESEGKNVKIEVLEFKTKEI